MAEINSPEIQPGKSKSLAVYASIAARILTGLAFFVFGLNGFLHFIPQPKTPMPSLIVAMMESGYMLPMIAGTEVVVGAMLLLNRFVALGLVLIAPIVVNIVAYHAFLAPSGMGIALVVLALEAYLVWVHRQAYRTMLAMRS